MARKSRKIPNSGSNTNKELINTKPATVYSVALYARKSADDVTRGRSGESIHTQMSLLKEYIKDKPEFHLYDCYMDNGETGTSFDRPQFNRLMEDVKAEKVNCVIVKDLSRFGRNYIETGKYMETIFPYLGIRFIAVNNGYDSASAINSNDMMALSAETLMDDMYSKDISQKVRFAYQTKFKAGEFAGSCVPYGYLRSPDDKHKLIVDEKTAPYVRLIYKMAAEGMTYAKIAEQLNHIGAETPGHFSHRANNGEKKFTDRPWQDHNIRNVLRNPVYLGHMVQGKTARSAINSKDRIKLPESEWYVVHNTQEAIIDETLWAAVKPVLDKNMSSYSGKKNTENREKNILSKKLICAECGKNISRSCYYTKGKRVYYYDCRTRNENGKQCDSMRMRADKLFDVILKAIQFHIKLMVDAQELLPAAEKHLDFHQKEDDLKKEISELSAQKKKIEYSKIKSYEDYRDGILSLPDYKRFSKEYENELKRLESRLDTLSAEFEKERILKSRENPCLKEFTGLKRAKKLTGEMIDTLIDKIYVHGQYEIEIVFRFRDEYEYLMRELEAVK